MENRGYRFIRVKNADLYQRKFTSKLEGKSIAIDVYCEIHCHGNSIMRLLIIDMVGHLLFLLTKVGLQPCAISSRSLELQVGKQNREQVSRV